MTTAPAPDRRAKPELIRYKGAVELYAPAAQVLGPRLKRRRIIGREDALFNAESALFLSS
jgi:hypothetical protein